MALIGNLSPMTRFVDRESGDFFVRFDITA